MPKSTDLRRVCLITGASRGIGKAIAARMARMGMDLFLTGRSREDLEKLERTFEKEPVKVVVHQADFEREGEPESVVASCRQAFGRLDILINNAGVALSRSVEDTTAGDWDRLMQVNARAPFFLTRAVIPLLRKSPSAVIVNVSSVVGRLGYPLQAAYGASKHALVGFSKVLAKELQKDNIRVHVIAPGGVDTDLVREMRPDIDAGDLIGPDEIADIVEFLVGRKGRGVIDEINIRRANGTPWS